MTVWTVVMLGVERHVHRRISGEGGIQRDTEDSLQGVNKNWMRSEQMQFQ